MTPRKITAGLFISLDGVVEAPETWHFPYFSDEMDAAVMAMQEAADTLLMGRRTYEGFAAFWPGQEGDMADRLNSIDKLVVSTTMTEATWQNSKVLSGDIIGQLKELKDQPGKNITVSGSVSLTRSLLDAGLLDELRLLIHPVVVGTGERLFPEGHGAVPLKLTESVVFSTGVLDVTYVRAE